jgi:hypothetical protein
MSSIYRSGASGNWNFATRIRSSRARQHAQTIDSRTSRKSPVARHVPLKPPRAPAEQPGVTVCFDETGRCNGRRNRVPDVQRRRLAGSGAAAFVVLLARAITAGFIASTRSEQSPRARRHVSDLHRP